MKDTELISFDVVNCRPHGMWCDVAFRMMVRKIFSPFRQLVSQLVLYLLTIYVPAGLL